MNENVYLLSTEDAQLIKLIHSTLKDNGPTTFQKLNQMLPDNPRLGYLILYMQEYLLVEHGHLKPYRWKLTKKGLKYE